jgi:hypothetical protein
MLCLNVQKSLVRVELQRFSLLILAGFWQPVLSGFSSISVHSSSTAFLVVIFDGRDLHLSSNFDAILFHPFEVQFCREKEEKIDALKRTK